MQDVAGSSPASSTGQNVEVKVAQQLGHSLTNVFEMVYWRVLKSRRREGHAIMDTIVAQRVV
jgi:hypothetical protein